MEDAATDLKRMIDSAQKVVFFGGAGVSTESGLPDFRSQSTLEASLENFGHTPETILSADFFWANPKEFYRYVKEMLHRPNAKPGPAHQALAALEEEGKLTAVVTQNIDGLHQQAGSTNVLELHGTLANYHCVDCGEAAGAQAVIGQLDAGEPIPQCACGGLLKPAVVLYQEGLPEETLAAAARSIRDADLLIVAGTSLVVQPAASLVSLFQGDNVVVINKEETPLDSYADLVIHDSVGAVLQRALA